jgi:hypothetical protein
VITIKRFVPGLIIFLSAPAGVVIQDADWYLEDTDFNGRYDRQTVIGVGIFTTKVDIAVPTNVKLSRVPAQLCLP